jgi:hypothetical protein
MDVEIQHNFSTITEKVIAIWYENSNPAAEIGRTVLNTPHIDGDVLIVPNLNNVIHRFKFYQSDDGVSLGNLLHTWAVKAKDSTQLFKVYHYVVDRGNTGADPFWSDPIGNGDTLSDGRLKGAQEVVILADGGTAPLDSSEYDLLADGGFTLNGGRLFANLEKWTVIALFSVAASGDGSGPSPVSSTAINIVSENGDFDASFYSKDNIAGFSEDVGSTVFPAFATIPSGTRANFSTYSGDQKFWSLVFSDGDQVRFRGRLMDAIHLGVSESIELFFDSGNCYVLEYHGDYPQVGKRDFADILGPNQLLRDGAIYDIIDYPRIVDFINQLPAAQVIGVQATWIAADANKHKWYYNEGAGKFGVPNDANMHLRALKTFNGVADPLRVGSDGALGGANSNIPGAFQDDDNKQHSHRVNTGGNAAGADPGKSLIRQAYNGDGYGGQGTGGSSNGPYIETVGSEARGKNVGQLAIVWI